MSKVEKIVAALFLLSLASFVVLVALNYGRFWQADCWLSTNSLEKALTPLALITLAALGYLAYFYKHRAEQAEAALRQVNTALESSHELVDTLINCDTLTDTLNRKGIEKFIEPDMRLARRVGVPIVALIVDCDDFRQINDRFGLDGGDLVLKELALRLKRSARRSDRIARVDSNQFLMLLHEASASDAAQVAERIAAAIANEPVVLGSHALSVSLSLGMSILPYELARLADIMTLVRPSLQKSKAMRKNKVL